MVNQKKNSRPLDRELELSLFGKGVGECAVIHLGMGRWMIVDSFETHGSKMPIALEYLRELQVDVARDVQIVVVTHWHDDHIRGMHRIVEEASSARFVCSAACKTDQFLALVLAEATSADRLGVSEFADILNILNVRNPKKKGPHNWAQSGMCLFSRNAVEVHALSPSPETITDCMGEFAKLLQVGPRRPFPRVTPNGQSTVLLVKTGHINFLLGGDLECKDDDLRGWGAILNSDLPMPQSCAYKVAHHGSSNADHDDIWNTLLLRDPHALVAPYVCGRKPLPSNDDVLRMKKRTDWLYCTVSGTGPKTTRSVFVDKTIDQVTSTRRSTWRRSGHIRLRVAIGASANDVRVDTFDGASRL